MASFGSALTFVLLADGTATVNHLNNPVHVGAGRLVGCPHVVPVRRETATGAVLDVWETFSDTDWLSNAWTQADGTPIPEPPADSFGAAFDAMRANPGERWAPLTAKPGVEYYFDDWGVAKNFRLCLPYGLGMEVRPAFPAREMRGAWVKISEAP